MRYPRPAAQDMTLVERPARPVQAFTLIELLTVIAIIGILAAILIPVAGRVREQAQSAKCVANLRTTSLGLLRAAENNRGKLSVVVAGSIMGKPELTNSFWALMAADVSKSPYALPDSFYCPSYTPYKWDPVAAAAAGKAVYGNTYGFVALNTDYAGNTSNVNENNGGDYTTYNLVLNRVPSFSRHLVLVDSVDSTRQSQMYSIISYNASTERAIHTRHRGKANGAFLDGHAEAMSRQRLKDLGFLSVYNDKLKKEDL